MEKCKDVGGHSDCRNEASEEPHGCPYQENVNNNPDFECKCCEECMHQCCMDI